MAGLGGGVDDGGGFKFFDECEDRSAIPYIELVMTEGGEGFDETVLIPAGVPAWSTEIGPLVIVDSVDFLAEFTPSLPSLPCQSSLSKEPTALNPFAQKSA